MILNIENNRFILPFKLLNDSKFILVKLDNGHFEDKVKDV